MEIIKTNKQNSPDSYSNMWLSFNTVAFLNIQIKW